MTMSKKAVIYCRVSSKQQILRGSGISSQEQLCRKYCKLRGYSVEKVFKEKGLTGGLLSRPALNEMLLFLKENRKEGYVVVFDDLKRFARDVEVHFALRKSLAKVNAKPESPTFEFDDSSQGKFIETMLAASAELERNQNKEQVIRKQKARLEQGYWPFCYPKGFVNIRTPEHGKLLTHKEPYAGIYTKAIEGFASNLLVSEVDVKNFINSEYIRHGLNDYVGKRKVRSILTKVLYAGYIEYPKWNVERRKGKHKGLVSIEIFNKVQEKLQKRSHKSPRKDFRPDFPLRGYVLCSNCNMPFTASWNRGNGGSYPNYFCKQQDCDCRWKVIRKYKIEEEFESLLGEKAKIQSGYLMLAKEVFTDVIDKQVKDTKQVQNTLKTKIRTLEDQINTVVDRYSKTQDDDVAQTLEERIKKLKLEKELLQQKSKTDISKIYTKEKLGTAFDTVSNTLQNPLVVWKSNDLQKQSIVLEMYFDELLKYDRENGFGTTTFSYPVRVLQSFEKEKSQLVEMGGVEPPC